jgi:carboxylate-amine ligase
LYKLIKQNLGFRLYRRALIAENKWRAARYGIQGKLIDFGKKEEVDTKSLIDELLAFVDDVADELNSKHELEYIRKIVGDGTGADRQLEIYEQSYDTKSVVDYIIEETHVGLEQKK